MRLPIPHSGLTGDDAGILGRIFKGGNWAVFGRAAVCKVSECVWMVKGCLNETTSVGGRSN